ncbi:hypothetical protein RN001_008945 [Aquatica leii]|uniref:Venom dipeptidyl peptidase 4 n=1 Tax=Aquatica leii TaxID=1421715 RepID=A0AAN7SHP6_9COLE|nr:hypothetical protein RN001_008945 [Aquatica leii]
MYTFTVYILLFVTTTTTLQPFTLEEILSGTYSDNKWNGTWISDTVFWFKDSEHNIRLFDASKNSSKIYLNADIYSKYLDSTIVLSKNMRYALIRHNQNLPTPHTVVAQYTVYDIHNNQYYHLHYQQCLQLVKWAPHEGALVYVYKNNIYYLHDAFNVYTPQQITRDGIPGVVYNGVTDYIYKGSTLWFSPNGNRLAFAHFDDTDVSDFHYILYGESHDQYPSVITLKYPKVGTTNPKVVLKYVDLCDLCKSFKVVEMKGTVDLQLLTDDYIYQDAFWISNEDLVGVFQNRVQNATAVVRCNVDTHHCVSIYAETSSKGWITTSSPIFNNDNSKFLIIVPEQEENDTYNHLSLIDNSNFNNRNRLTYGRRIVSSVCKWDTISNLMWYVVLTKLTLSNYFLIRYYIGSTNESSSHQQVFQFNLNTNSDSCLTCNFITPEGFCKFASAEFSTASSYAAIICKGPGPTIVQIQSLKSLEYFEWENNYGLRNLILKKLIPIQRNIKVNTGNGFVVHVRLLIPPEHTEDANIKYPMIVHAYGGPDSNLILDEYSIGLENYFVTNRKYIYAVIDGRGSGRYGNNFLFQVHRQLGSVEVEDQIEVTKYLQKQYNFIDASKTGIWGGSYGGFLTLLALAKDTDDVFKWGIAIAPVTNFNHYSSIYTEKYMGLNTDKDNKKGYENTDIANYVENLRNKLFCIIHGSADSNVHYQHSMLLFKALREKNINFCQQSYPDQNHNFQNSFRHLYQFIDSFIKYGFLYKSEK